jgi:uncharacterized protein (DUF885 family)
MTSAAPRTPTSIDSVAEAYLTDLARLDPILATSCGLPGHDRELPDLSPDGHRSRRDLAAHALVALGEAGDPVDAVTQAALRERLSLLVELHDAGETQRDLNVIESPLQRVRGVFDLMPRTSADECGDVTARLAAVPAALAGYQRSLAEAAAGGRIAAVRQVTKVAAQCAEYGAADGFFSALAADAGGTDLPASLRADLERAGRAASAAVGELGEFLETELAPAASAVDAVGRERYERFSREFLGARVDLDEAYEWGLGELARIEAEMDRVSAQVVPGGTLADAIDALNADPARQLVGTAALQDWLQDFSDRALAELAASHFEVPEPIRRLDCRIAPTSTGGIYYTPPSEDLTRPGTMWWSVPKGVSTFSTWQEITTIYHEGVPGHHLQCAQVIFQSQRLNRWRRLGCWVSGHGEGWALYAERLMAELGYLDEPGAHLGMLDAQALRSARVVVDLGVHLGLPAPAEVGGGRWDADRAARFLRSHTRIAQPVLDFELDRYLGWPGQAPSYKLGEREWLRLREQARARAEAAGRAFDLRVFHREALDIGSVGMDILDTALRRPA